jgi:hypothetical protein
MNDSRIEIPISAQNRRFLRYWAVNMSIARAAGWAWIPGFSYDAEETERLDAIAGTVSRNAVLIWLMATTIFLILFVLAAILGVMIPLITTLWPDPSKMSGLGFGSIMGLLLLVSIGGFMPLSIGLAGGVADRLAGGSPPPDQPGDAELSAKIRRQFWRLCAILATFLIPGFLIFLTFDIDPGWLLVFIRITAVFSIVLGVVSHFMSRRSAGR